MTLEIGFVFLLLVLAVLLFATEWLSIDLTTLLIVAAMVAGGLLTPEEAFAGFAQDIIFILCSIFVISGALVKTGVLDSLGLWLGDRVQSSEALLTAVLMLICAGMSAFISNTTATAILMPAVLMAGKASQISPGRLLIPLSFASMLGGTCTVIGTSTNMASSGLIQRAGLEPFSILEFFPVGALMVGAGTLFMSLLGRRFLPATLTGSPGQDFKVEEYLSEILVPADSPLVGKELSSTGLGKLGLTALAILRGDHTIYPHPDTYLEGGDVLLVQGHHSSLLKVKEDPHLVIEAEKRDQDPLDKSLRIVEAVVMPQSDLIGNTPRILRFRQRFGVTILAVQRGGRSFPVAVSDVKMRAGDVLLLQGPPEQLEALEQSRDLRKVTEVEYLPFRRRRGIYALLALGLAVGLGATHMIPLSIAFLLGAITVILLRCIDPPDIYDVIDWRLIVLIGGMSSFGLAMQKTGAAQFLAVQLIEWCRPLGLYPLLASLMLLTVALTQPLSNAAAALLVLPLGLSTAEQLGVNPRSVAVLITLSASMSFITPLEPSCLLVYSAGKYRFLDFIKTGLPLTVLALLIVLLTVPLIWPL